MLSTLDNPSLVFLDIDGVLNDHKQHTNGYLGTIPSCVVCFNDLLVETGASIVISSAWRYMVLNGAMTLRGFEYLLLTHGVDCKDRVIGMTCSDEDIPLRGQQIRHWMNEYGDGRRYVVLDDLDLGISEAEHPFVQTVDEHGLELADVNLAIWLLNGQKTRKDCPCA